MGNILKKCFLIGSLEKIKMLYLYFYKTYNHQPPQAGYLGYHVMSCDKIKAFPSHFFDHAAV